MYILLIGVIIHACITVTNSMSCDEGWLEYQGKCFKHYSKNIDWSGAQETCVVFRNAKLATVDSPETNTFVQNKLTDSSDVWIGLSIPDMSKSSWKWSDGGNIAYYDDWNVAVVTSACAVMKYGNNRRYWFTKPCTYENYYVCEKEMTNDNCSGWFLFETHCYLFMTDSKNTNMAAARSCWQYEAYLVSINSQHEADFIYSNVDMNREYWIGLSPLRWVNNEPYQWNNWGDIGPTHNVTYGCVFMNVISGKWFCGNCEFFVNMHLSYICQRDAVIDFSTTSNVAIEDDTSTSTVLGELHTTESDALNISNIQSLKDNSKYLLLTTVVLAVCVGLVAIIVVIVVVIVIRRRRRRLASQDAKPKEQAIYYNDIKKTTDNEIVKRTDTNPTKTNETKQHVQTKDSHTPSAGDTERNTYEILSVGPYVNSGQIQAGTYASLH